MKRSVLSLATTVGVLLLMGSAPASAASPNGLVTISPPIKQITIASGLLQADIVVTLANSTGSDVGVTIKTSDFTPLSNGSIVFGTHGLQGTQSGLAAWMSLPEGPNLTVKAGQKADVHVVIDNRSDLAPGGHYGAVIFSTVQLNPTGANKVALNQQLTSLFFVKKVGGDVARMEFVSLKPDSNSGLPTESTIVFKSTGNVYVVPRGYVQVTDAQGKLLAKGLINPESTLVPQTLSRSFDTILQPVSGVKSFKAPFKMTAYYRYDGQTQLQSTSVLIDKPSSRLKILATLGPVLIVVALLIRLRPKKRRK